MNNIVSTSSNRKPIVNKGNYILSSSSNLRPDNLNYKQMDYNNYQSWSNVRNGFINVNQIDENSNVINNYFKFSRLQPLDTPFDTVTDVSLSWAPYNSIHSQPNDRFMNNRNNRNNMNKNNNNKNTNKNNN